MSERGFVCGLVRIDYDTERPCRGATPPPIRLPEGYEWYWCERRPLWQRILWRLEGARAIPWGWQFRWSEPIVIAPGETINLLIPM